MGAPGFLLISQISIMYTVHFDGFNTAVCSYSFAISQHVLKKNLILNTESINRLFEEKMLLAKNFVGNWIHPRTEKMLLAPIESTFSCRFDCKINHLVHVSYLSYTHGFTCFEVVRVYPVPHKKECVKNNRSQMSIQ